MRASSTLGAAETAAAVGAVVIGVSTAKLTLAKGVSLVEDSKQGADGVDDVFAGLGERFSGGHHLEGERGVDLSTDVGEEVHGVGALRIDDDPVVEHGARTSDVFVCRGGFLDDGFAGLVEKRRLRR